ncbi:MAG: YgiQ family radical SAM protein [Bacteroidales bacterium]|nr:YgiQ family radical SAM protein [Bacteroidales bacterium]
MFPTSVKEVQALGWDSIDIILFSGDAFIDHPSFGTAVIARWLQKWGYKVAVVPQPNWRDDLRDFRKLGRPRLYFGLNAGAMDSMVNHYTASKRLRHDDAYTPDGKAGARPDYAVTVYTQILKKLFPDVPVVIGGIEASLRRLTHYDYWKDCLMPSVLVSSGADYLCYGMGERPMLELTKGIEKGWSRHRMLQIPQIAFYINKKYSAPKGVPPETSGHPRPDKREGPAAEGSGRGRSEAEAVSGGTPEGVLVLHSFEECCRDKRAFAENFHWIETHANMMHPDTIIEPVGEGYVQINPPYPPATTQEMDSFWDLPFTKLPHPRYKGKRIPAYDMIKFSVNTHRGCFGGCNFCTIAAHQGKFIQSRSEKSILKEVQDLNQLPDFAGNISDVGAPTANMYGMHGKNLELCDKCKRRSCLFPKRCPNLECDHTRLMELYKRIDNTKGIRHSYIGSGIRYDLFLTEDGFVDNSSKPYLKTLVLDHTSGRLKVAPEHTEDHVLQKMAKPSFKLFEHLRKEFDHINREAGTHVGLVPYFISSHPGCTLKDMEKLANHPALKGIWMDQVQDFTPTPMTTSSVMYYSGLDPRDMTPVFTERDPEKKQRQKSYFFKNSSKKSEKRLQSSKQSPNIAARKPKHK